MDDRKRKALGLHGEQLALDHARAHGLKLVARNYRCKLGEIDLVMLDGKTLTFIEVRYRARTDYGGAAASVDWLKQRRLVSTAEHLLMSHPELKRYSARFDVMAIESDGDGISLDWIKQAFTV